MKSLEALRKADFDWAVHLEEIWGPPRSDAPELHAKLRDAFARKIRDMEEPERSGSPLGWFLVGPGGAGKTHILGAFRREAARLKHPFILVDLTDVRTFWASVLQGYVDSLQQQLEEGVHQYRWVLGNIIEKLGPSKPAAQILETLSERKSDDLRGDANKVLSALSKVWPRQTMKYHNVIRAILCMNSDDFGISHLGQSLLRGQGLEPEDKRALGFTVEQEAPTVIIEALSWFLSLSGPAVLAFDQIDPIVTQLHFRKEGDPSTEEQATAESIISEIGGGLGTLRDITRNTLTIVSCMETTWGYLQKSSLKTFLDRFEEPFRINVVPSADLAMGVVSGRLGQAFRAAGFTAPYPTYPFKPEAFGDLVGSSPREILKRCSAHIQNCIADSDVKELARFDQRAAQLPSTTPITQANRLDGEFESLRAQADPAWLLEEKHDDERLAPLIRSGLACVVHESGESTDVRATVEVQFTGGAKTVPLHARLRRVFHKEEDREDHICVRAIQHANARAYQNQLTAALTTSGIDRRLKFRRLAVVRSLPLPGGAKTAELNAQFDSLGGVFVTPSHDDLRTLHALDELRKRNDPEFLPWLRGRRLASGLVLMKGILGPLFGDETSEAPTVQTTNGEAKTPIIIELPPPETTEPNPDLAIPLGRRLAGGTSREALTLPVRLLEKHTLVMAGAGSGKTVFLRRLVEEAALAGVPSIVVDCANDLAALGDRWDAPPSQWVDGDPEKADRYHVPGRVVVWTPNRVDGNPLWFEPLPDLAALADDREELDGAVEGACEALLPIVAKGKTQATEMKRGLLSRTLRYMAARGGRGMDELIEILSDLPAEAGLGVAKEAKHAADMADALRVVREVDPLMKARGTPFDPALLFGPTAPDRPARVSVISLIGLSSLEAQRRFLNQLAMTLFAWIKKNPDPGDRPLRGLLVIDEAKDFIPSGRASTCRESLLRLGAQARKYHLGLVFATQNPKDVDPKLVANCSTHVYGKMNAPVAIEAVRDLIRMKGGSGEDVPRLPAGRFYVHNADAAMSAPVRIEAAFSLSRHPASPLDEPAVLARAAASRPSMNGNAGLASRPLAPQFAES